MAHKMAYHNKILRVWRSVKLKKKMTNFSTSDKFTIIHYSISNFILPLLYYYIQRTVLHHYTCVVTRLGSCSSNAKIPGRFPWLADWFHLFSRYPT